MFQKCNRFQRNYVLQNNLNTRLNVNFLKDKWNEGKKRLLFQKLVLIFFIFINLDILLMDTLINNNLIIHVILTGQDFQRFDK